MLSRRRGATLVELLVSLAVTTTTMALLLGILLQTRHQVSRGQARLSVQSCARAVAREIDDALEGAIRPSALDAAPASLAPRFSPTQCEVLNRGRLSQDGRMEWTTIESLPEGVQIHTRTLPAPSALQETRRPGVRLERFITSVRFRYALENDSEIVWRDRLATGEYPRAVETRATVADKEDEEQTCEIIQVTRLL